MTDTENRQETDNQDGERSNLSPSKELAENVAGANNAEDVTEEDAKKQVAAPNAPQSGKKLLRKQTSQMLEAELKSGGFFGKNCDWITCSLLAGLTMGTGSFLYASKYADLGFKGGGLTGPGVFIIFLVIWVVRQTAYRCKNGRWTKKTGSRLLWDDGRLKWSNLVPFLGNVTVNVSYLIVMTYAWYFAELGGINQGVVSALLALASLINVVTFYFGFGEKISYLHFVGVIFMVASVVCIGAAAGSHGGGGDASEEELAEGGGRSQTMNGVLAIICGLGGPTVVSTQHFLIRKYKPQYDGIAQALDAAILEFFILTMFLFPLSSSGDFTITWSDLGVGMAAGLLMCMGRVFVTIGVAIGLAGPAEALMSTHALYQSLLSAIFDGQSLSVLEILGVLLGLAGVFFMAFLDTCVDKYKLKKEIKRLKAVEAAEKAAGEAE